MILNSWILREMKYSFVWASKATWQHISTSIFYTDLSETFWLPCLFQAGMCHSCLKFSYKQWIATNGIAGTTTAIIIYLDRLIISIMDVNTQ